MSEGGVQDEKGRKPELKPMPVRRRSAARVAAVQIGYQARISSRPASEIVPEYLEHHVQELQKMFRIKKLDEGHLSELSSTIESRNDEFDEMLRGCLAKGHSLERLNMINHAILLAGTCELATMPQHPARAVMSEYAGIADVCGGDVGLVTAILDKLAKRLRGGELEGTR